MKKFAIAALFAAIPAFAATGSNAPAYYHPQSYKFSADGYTFARTDGNRMPSSYKPGSLLQEHAFANSDDSSAPRLDGNRTPGMFRGDRR